MMRLSYFDVNGILELGFSNRGSKRGTVAEDFAAAASVPRAPPGEIRRSLKPALPHIPEPNHHRLIIGAIADELRARNRRWPEFRIGQHLGDAEIVAPPIIAPEPAFGMFDHAQPARDLETAREQIFARTELGDVERHNLDGRISTPRRIALPRSVAFAGDAADLLGGDELA